MIANKILAGGLMLLTSWAVASTTAPEFVPNNSFPAAPKTLRIDMTCNYNNQAVRITLIMPVGPTQPQLIQLTQSICDQAAEFASPTEIVK